MAVYGAAQYGKALYGADRDVDYTVVNLAAVQSDYGRITLSWDAPPLSDWTSLTLVRSQYGFPVAVTDGVALALFPVAGTHTDYSDTDLPPGYWYYTLFLASPFPSWSAADTYATGDRVSYSGQVWDCVAPYALNVTPGTNPAVWVASYETTLYRAAGSIACLAVRDYAYGALLQSLIPSPYAVAPGTSTDTGAPNPDLASFLGVLGFGFAQVNTELDDLLEGYNVLTTRQDRLYALSAALGLSAELASSARYQRLRTLKAAYINQEKGTAQGVADTVFAATGLKASVVTGPNLMLTQDQSAFLSPVAPPWDPSEPYKIGDEVVYLGTRYACTGFTVTDTPSNYVANAVTGAPNTLGTVTIAGSTFVKETAVAPASVTVPFTAPANASYLVLIDGASGPDYGVLTATIDGAAVTMRQITSLGFGGFGGPTSYSASLDLYSASAAAFNIGLAAVPLTPGSHTLVLSTATKNASSSGYGQAFASINITGSPALYPPGNPPTGAAGSAAQWSASAPNFDTVYYFNPVTGGQSTWTSVGSSCSLAVGYLGA